MRLLIIEDEYKLSEAMSESLRRENYIVDVSYDGEDGLNKALKIREIIMRLLIIEDEYKLSEAMSESLRRENYIVDVSYDGEDGLNKALKGIYDVIILDLMLPKINGFEILKYIRGEKISTHVIILSAKSELEDKVKGLDIGADDYMTKPKINGFEILKYIRGEKISTHVIILSAKSELEDKVKGLDIGADDYMTKPFYIKELLARLRVFSRRNGEIQDNSLLFGNLKLDLKTCEISNIETNQSMVLSGKEFALIEFLFRNKNQVVNRDQITERIWGYENDSQYNNVEVYLSFIRKKIKFLEEFLFRNKNQVVNRDQITERIWGYENDSQYNNVEVYLSFIRKKIKFLEANMRIKAIRGLGYILEEIND